VIPAAVAFGGGIGGLWLLTLGQNAGPGFSPMPGWAVGLGSLGLASVLVGVALARRKCPACGSTKMMDAMEEDALVASERFAAQQGAADGVSGELEKALRIEIDAHLRTVIEAELRAAHAKAIDAEKAALRVALEQELQGQAQHQRADIERTLRPAIETQVRAELADQAATYERALRKTLEAELRPELERSLRPRLEKELRPQIEHRLRPELEKQVRASLEKQALTASEKPAEPSKPAQPPVKAGPVHEEAKASPATVKEGTLPRWQASSAPAKRPVIVPLAAGATTPTPVMVGATTPTPVMVGATTPTPVAVGAPTPVAVAAVAKPLPHPGASAVFAKTPAPQPQAFDAPAVVAKTPAPQPPQSVTPRVVAKIAAPLPQVPAVPAASTKTPPPQPQPPAPSAPTAAAPSEHAAKVLAVTDVHERAKRRARVIVSDLLLYEKAALTKAAKAEDSKKELGHLWNDVLRSYNQAIPPEVRSATNYLEEELDRCLAKLRQS
jgi:hypothetical protein